MNFILTLVSSHSGALLSTGHMALVYQFFNNHHISLTENPVWLEKNKAADIGLTDKPSPTHLKQLHDLLAADRIDCFIQSASLPRQKKLLVADMDSTMVEGETLDDLAAHCGLKEKISAITARAMKGDLDFKEALRARVAMLKDLPEVALKETLSEIKLMKGAKTLVQTMKHNNALCVLVSGGFTFFTGAIAWQIGFDAHHGNSLGLHDGALTGTVEGEILDRDSKVAFLKDYTQKQGIDLSETLAVGDGANDLDMLSIAGLGVGYHPKPLLKEKLDNLVLHGDLTALLYAQGYKGEEISIA